MKPRVQHPKIDECRDREKPYYFFRYWHDEVLPDGSIKTSPKRYICRPMKGKDAITKRRAEEIRNDSRELEGGVHPRCCHF